MGGACEHVEAAEIARAQRPNSVRFQAEEDLLALAAAAASAGVMGEREVDRVMKMHRAACASGVPLAAKLGDTGYFVVRDDGDSRYLPAGWAHVLSGREAGEGAAAVVRSRGGADEIEIGCKVR